MSNRGPLIQKQSFVKRAPRGKLSAFKKWEKKWLVFAVSRSKGPVLDFFDNRQEMEKGPTAANRIILEETKQVCAAIDCKVPHTFIVVTSTRILSIAAMSQPERDDWIATLRRVLGERGYLQSSSDDHTYEASGSTMTRQQQVRQNRSVRRPPPPLPDDDDDDDDEFDDDDGDHEPDPYTLESSDAQPSMLPSANEVTGSIRYSVQDRPPPPLPQRRTENDFFPKSVPSVEAEKNMQDVLANYEESPDTTYESGDHAAIAAAAVQESSAAVLDTLQSAAEQLHVSDEHTEGRERPVAPPVAARRTVARVEHDFSPAIAKQAQELAAEETRRDATLTYDSQLAESNTGTLQLGSGTDRNPASLPSPSQKIPQSEEVYENAVNVSSDGHKRSMPAPAPRRVPSFNQAKQTVSKPTKQTAPTQTKQTAPAHSDARRINRLAAQSPSSAANKPLPPSASGPSPVNQSHDPADDDYQENYENALGLFGHGVASNKSSSTGRSPYNSANRIQSPRSPHGVRSDQTKTMSDKPERPKPRLRATKSQDSMLPPKPTDGARPELPVKTRNRQNNAGPTTKNPSSRISLADMDDGLSEDECAPTAARSPTGVVSESPMRSPSVDQKPVNSNNRQGSSSEGDDDSAHLARLSAKADNQHMPADEAPPPYTPPRLLQTDTHNMDAIKEDMGTEPSTPLSHPPTFIYQTESPSGTSNGDTIIGPNTISNTYANNQLYDSLTTKPKQIASPEYLPTKPVVNDSYKSGSIAAETSIDGDLPTLRRNAPINAPKVLGVAMDLYNSSPRMRSSNRRASVGVIRLEDSFPRMPATSPTKSSAPPIVPPPRADPVKSRRKSCVATFEHAKILAEVQNGKEAEGHKLTTQTEDYERVIPERERKAQQDLVADVTRRLSNCGQEGRDRLKQRRKSAPPSSIPLINPVSSPGTQPKRSKQPLDGGTLLREGKIFRAPTKDTDSGAHLKQSQTETLKDEISHRYGVKVTVWRKDVKYALFVDINNSIWVAGWNQKERPLLQNIFHLGDKVLSVNGETFATAQKLNKMVKRADSETKFEIIVRRMPFGKAYFVHRNVDNEDIGIQFSKGSTEVCHITKNGLVAKLGLRINPNKAFGHGQCRWVMTEVNHRPLSLVGDHEEAEARLSSLGKDVTFVVQPKDFIDALRDALRDTFMWKDYLVS